MAGFDRAWRITSVATKPVDPATISFIALAVFCYAIANSMAVTMVRRMDTKWEGSWGFTGVADLAALNTGSVGCQRQVFYGYIAASVHGGTASRQVAQL